MIKRIFNSAFLKFTSVVFAGNLLAQVITFIAFALFARYFDLANIGVYTVFISVVTLLSIPATGRYESAIMLPKEKKDAAGLLLLSLVLAGAFSLLLYAVVSLFSIAVYFEKLERIRDLLLLLPLGVFLMAAFQSFIIYFNKLHLFKLNAVLKVLQASGMLFISFLLAVQIGFSAKALVAGWIFSQGIVFVVYLFFYLLKNEKNSRKEIISLMRSYKRYPTISLLSNVVNTFSAELPNYFIPVFWGVNVQTLYAYSARVAAVPFNFIGSSVGQVFYSEATQTAIENPKELYPYLKKTTKILFLFSVTVFAIAFVSSSYLFPLFFGQDYAAAVPYFNCLVVAAIFTFVQSPISVISDVVNRLKPELVFTTSAVIIKVIVLFAAVKFLPNPVQMMAVYAVTSAGLSLFWISRLQRMAKAFSDSQII